MKKIMLISSAGGHYGELQKIEEFNNDNNIIITEKTKYIKDRKNQYYIKYGSRKNKIKYPFIFIFNSIKSFYFLLKFKPNIIISTGAHSCVSFFYLAKLLKIKSIYIESFAKVNNPSLTYNIIKNKADVVLVQHEELLNVYENSKFIGGVY